MKDMILRLAKHLVDKPDAVDVVETENGDTTQLLVKVAEEDKGKIIGKQGKVIKAIRSVASAAASKAGKKVAVDLD